MGMNALLSSLDADSAKEAGRILENARKQGGDIISGARKEGEENLSNAENEAGKAVEEQKRERTAWARLEAKRVISDEKEAAIRDALVQVLEEASKLRGSKQYAGFMADSAASAEKELGARMTVHVRKGDRKYVPKKYKAVEDLDASGGLIAESDGGKIRMNFTLEEVFETRKDELRRRIAQKLFG
ncbi:MAG: V-type ATP synthase subunit E [Candidatus Bilamarchaeaceae archaeon]